MLFSRTTGLGFAFLDRSVYWEPDANLSAIDVLFETFVSQRGSEAPDVVCINLTQRRTLALGMPPGISGDKGVR